jgi:hypothetical protein
MAVFAGTAPAVQAQLIKKATPKQQGPLDTVLISEKFSLEPLSEVYNLLHEKYGLAILYDTAFCKTQYFSYWFNQTPATLAMEITGRDLEISYSIDNNGIVRVKPNRSFNTTSAPPPSVKYTGEPEKKQFTLSGKVIDFFNGEALPFATVGIKGTTNATTTNSDGFFTLSNVASDTVAVLATYLGYRPQVIYLNPSADVHHFKVELMPEANTFHETVITANRDDLMKMSSATLGMVKLSPAKLSELPNVGEKDIMRAFQLMPGISAANESSSGLYVRGGTPDQNLILFDGFTIYHVDHLYGFFSAFNANALKDVQLYKGGFESKYGGRLSSVTEITGKEGNSKQFNLGGDVSLLSANVFTEIPITETLTLVGAYRRSWKGPIYNWIFDKFNKEDNTAQTTQPTGPGGMNQAANTQATSYFYDINAKLTFRPGKKDVMAFSFFNGSDKLDNSFSRSAPMGFSGAGTNTSFGTTDLTNYGSTGMSLRWSRKWNNHWYSNTVASYSNYHSKRDRSNERTVLAADSTESTLKTGVFENNDLRDYTLKSEYTWNAGRFNTIELGGFATAYDILYTYAQSDTAYLLNKHDVGLLTGGYLQDRIRLWHNKIDFKPGVRISYYDRTQQVYTEPRASLNFNFTDRISLKTSYGQFYQFANRITREDILSGSRDFWILSNGSSVPVSKATHYIAGLSYETDRLLFSAEGYYKVLDNLSEYALRFSGTRRNVTYEESFYTGKGYARGIELLAQKKTGKFTGWVSYTLAQARNQFDVYGTGYYPANQDVTHEFKVVGIYKWGRWDFSANWIFATGRPYTAPAGAYSIDLLDGNSLDYFTVTNKNSLRLPNYHRLDVSANWHFYNESHKDIGYIGLSIFNAYNHTNIWYKQFEVSDGQILETNVNYMGFTPNLTLSLKIR